MAKLAQSTIKYLIEADFTANGVVEKPDVIGAIFGQTEGLLGQDLDLRELQRSGRIGRIEVTLKTNKGKTRGKISIPSSLDGSETSLIAAAIETIERIGPCDSFIKLKSVKDIRAVKREYVMDRAKRILSKLLEEELPSTTELTEKIKESVRTSEITEYKGLPSGADVPNSEEIIVVEGRADVLNLLKNGIKNVIAMGGTTIPTPIIELCKEKTSTVFLDGDRGGDLILKEILQITNIDYIARAPEGKEVEELSKKEIFKALRDKTPIEQFTSGMKKDLNKKTKKKIDEILEKMVGTRAAYIFDESMKLQAKIPLTQFNEKNQRLDQAKIVVLDGVVNDDIVRTAEAHGIKFLIADKSEKDYKTKFLTIYTKEDLNV
ncbi:MAG: DNA primase DnaG [Methanosarcinales archaeon]